MNPFPRSGYEIPIKPDPRNFPLEKAQVPQAYPDTYITDISHIDVFNQLKIPDCVENAITFVKKYHEWKNTGIVPDLSRRSLVIPTVQRDGFSLDEGTSVENALYVAHKLGICESMYLLDDHNLTVEQFANPAAYYPSAKDNAATHTIESYAFVTDISIDGLKNAIYQNGVIVVGGLINKNWWTSQNGVVSWSKFDIDPIVPPTTDNLALDPSLSPHCFVLYGYTKDGFYLRNSFGPNWADQGNNFIPNSFVPFIYEAATIVDLTEEQIQTLKQAQSDVQAVQQVINNLDPESQYTPMVIVLIKQILAAITAMLGKLFS